MKIAETIPSFLTTLNPWEKIFIPSSTDCRKNVATDNHVVRLFIAITYNCIYILFLRFSNAKKVNSEKKKVINLFKVIKINDENIVKVVKICG